MSAKKRVSGKRKVQKKPMGLPLMRPNAAGIDVGAEEMWVAVPKDRDVDPVRRFGTFTGQLKRILDWLRSCEIDTVVMESTGVYWIPLYQMLADSGIEVCLVNARLYKNVAGRPTDAGDCQWLQYLHSVGLVRGSFRPSQAICGVRTLLRHRESLIQNAAQLVQHMQKSMDQMNVKLHNVLSDIKGVSGLAILSAIVSGIRDPRELAKLRDKGVRASEEVVIHSLEGDYRPEHVFVLGQCLRMYRAVQSEIEQLDREMEKFMLSLPAREPGEGVPAPEPRKRKPKRNEAAYDLRQHCFRIAGVDLTEVPGIEAQTAHVLLTEIGPDLSMFPTSSAFCSWLCLCPHNQISGGKVLSSRTRPSKNRAALALRLGANALHHSQTPMGDFLRRMKTRLGKPEAITATAHKLARMVYHLLTTKQRYDETTFAQQHQRQQKRRLERLKSTALSCGYTLTPINASQVQ
jgi:transposase